MNNMNKVMLTPLPDVLDDIAGEEPKGTYSLNKYIVAKATAKYLPPTDMHCVGAEQIKGFESAITSLASSRPNEDLLILDLAVKLQQLSVAQDCMRCLRDDCKYRSKKK